MDTKWYTPPSCGNKVVVFIPLGTRDVLRVIDPKPTFSTTHVIPPRHLIKLNTKRTSGAAGMSLTKKHEDQRSDPSPREKKTLRNMEDKNGRIEECATIKCKHALNFL